MTKSKNYITFSTMVGIAYACFGFLVLDIYPENVMLAMAIIIIAGMIPDIDAKSGMQAREVGALIAAIAPVMLLKIFPGLTAGGMSRLALVIIASYLFSRVVIAHVLQALTVHRGMMHSVPAAIITCQVVYLVFYDLYWDERWYVAGAGFIGFFSHLVLDAMGNFDLVGKAIGKEDRGEPVLKFFGRSWVSTLAAYACVLFLGMIMARDLYPGLPFAVSATY